MEIKRLRTESLCRILAFDKLCFPTDFWKEEDWVMLLEEERSVYYAVLDGEQIVGDVFLYNWKGEKDYIKIMNLAVHPDYRGRGLAHRLLNHAAGEMTKIEMRRFCGETRASNRAMQRVFEDCGYRLNCVEADYYDHPRESAYKYVLNVASGEAVKP